MKTNKRIKCLLLIFFTIIPNYLFSQDNYDVLPSEGRNKLFFNYLLNELDTMQKERQAALADALTTVEKLQERQSKTKADYFNLLGELPSEKTPLNDSVVGTIAGNGYNIDKLYFESVPNHHVTGHFYYPTNGEGPYPGILILCGHYASAKSDKVLQNLCITLVKNNFAVLVVDPICQAERYQVMKTGTRNISYMGSTTAISRLDVGCMLLGTSTVAYEVWDNLRAIDYLLTRPEVDTSKIGCTGSSGGGAQATYLCAYDSRIKVAAVNSYLMNEPTLYATDGPQTGSQNLSYEGLYQIDHPEYITMFAPKPFMILCDSADFFAIEGTQETYAEVQQVYEKFGVPEQFGYAAFNNGHGYNVPVKRETAAKWFRTWFYNDSNIIEEADHNILTVDTLLVTDTGQVVYAFPDEKTITDLNIELSNSLTQKRNDFWKNNTKDSCINMVKNLIKYNPEYESPVSEVTETIDRENYTLQKIKITSGNDIPVTGLFFMQKEISGKVPAILYVNGKGKGNYFTQDKNKIFDADDNSIIEQVYIDSGYIVLSVDLRGWGETKDYSSDPKHGSDEHATNVISQYMGQTLIGQRVQDIQKSMDILLSNNNVDENSIKIVGLDRSGTAVLHAAVIDNRINEVEIRSIDTLWMNDTSWADALKNPNINNLMTHVVPSALIYYDLSDLVKAISPRKVIYNPVDYNITDIKNPYNINNQNVYLEQNFPNPFRSSTSISYAIPETGHVSIVLLDHTGRKIKSFVNTNQAKNDYSVELDVSTLETGIYIYCLKLNGKTLASKIMTKIN